MSIQKGKKWRSKKECLEYWIRQSKRDARKTLGPVEYLKRYEPEEYRKLLHKGF